ncbi:hypothetical protein PENSPDRAFT_578145, partial [Peniophora sp. CONT]
MSSEEPFDVLPFAKSLPEDAAGDGLWKSYLKAVKGEDEASVESWNGSTQGILTFAGLFSAAVATFLVDSQQSLQVDTGAQTVALLALSVPAANVTATTLALAQGLPPLPFQPQRSDIVVNTLWFISLVISLVCSLLATLVQEWTRHFKRSIRRNYSDMTIREYSMNHIFQRMGVERYGLDKVTTVIIAMIHVSVALFLVGLGVSLSPI